MSNKNAVNDAINRINKLPIPPEPERLDGLTVTLLDFETDGVTGGLVGGNSATYQRMVNRAGTKLLKRRGAIVKVTTVKLDAVLQWDGEQKPLTLMDRLLDMAEVLNAVIMEHRDQPARGDEFHKRLEQVIKDARLRLA